MFWRHSIIELSLKFSLDWFRITLCTNWLRLLAPQNFCVVRRFPCETISARSALPLAASARFCASAHRDEYPDMSGLLLVLCRWSSRVSLSVYKRRKISSAECEKHPEIFSMGKSALHAADVQPLLTRSLLQTQALPVQGGERWSRSRSTRGCGVHGGNSTVPHTRQRSILSLYLSPVLPPGCCMPSAPYSYSLCKTCERENCVVRLLLNLRHKIKRTKTYCRVLPVFTQVCLKCL